MVEFSRIMAWARAEIPANNLPEKKEVGSESWSG